MNSSITQNTDVFIGTKNWKKPRLNKGKKLNKLTKTFSSQDCQWTAIRYLRKTPHYQKNS